VPAGAEIVEGAGRYVMPGLVDAHVHLEYFDDPALLRLFLAHGVTTVRNMDGRPQIVAWRDAIRERTLIGPRIVTAGPILDGAPPLLPDNLSIATPAAGREAVAAQAALGYDFVKVYTNLAPDVYAAIVEEARARGLRVAGHVPRAISVATAAASQASIEHLADIGRWAEADDSPYRGKFHWSKLVLAAPLDAQKVANVADQLAAAGTHVVPTMVQVARSVATEARLTQWLAEPEVAQLPVQFRDEWASRVRRASSRLEGEDWQIVERGVQQRRDVVRALHDANVQLLVGTDTPNPFVVPGAAVQEELQHLVDAGLPIAAVLVAATRAPCEFLRLDCGVIAAGKRADLLIMDRNPLQSVANVRPGAVMVGGRFFSRE
ncbi:MAG TPA: amidohydrolase family protein, partial [Thermoanaerobaculia bacterium]